MMTANEIFNILLEDCNELDEVINEEIDKNGYNQDIMFLKEHLAIVRGQGEELVAQISDCSATNDKNKYKFIVFVIEHLCSMESLALRIWGTRLNSQASKVLDIAGDIHKKIRNCIVEELQ